jgi:hypothetical protein
VIESEVHHGIGAGCSAAHAFHVFEVTPVRLGTSSGKSLCTRFTTGKAEHLMPRIAQLPDDRGTHKAGGPGNENAHVFFLLKS